MNYLSKLLKPLLTATYITALSFSASSLAIAHGHQEHNANQQTDIMVMNGYARATFPLAKTGAVYFTLHNQSDKDKILTSVTVHEELANEAQIHTTVMEGDVMKMRELADGVTIGAGEMVSFESGGYHIMLLGLNKGLVEGSELKLTLIFEGNDELDITLPVKKDDAKSHHSHH